MSRTPSGRFTKCQVALYLALFVLAGTVATAQDDPGLLKPGKKDLEQIRALFYLDDADWKLLNATHEVEAMPPKAIVQILYRLRQRLVEDLLREQVDPNAANRTDSQKNLSESIAGLPQGSVVEQTEGATVRRITRFDVEAANAESEFKQYFVCNVTLADHMEVVCVTSRIPQAWLDGVSVQNGVPITFEPPKPSGFLGVVVSSGEKPVLAASRMRECSDSLLGRHGMDVSLLDDVRPIPIRDLKAKKASPRELKVLKFTSLDFEPFYRMLLIASAIPPSEIDREIAHIKKEKGKGNPFPVSDLFNRPERQQGRLVRYYGYARRVERIDITDDEAVKRFGIDHYFQIAFFTEDAQDNPIMICMKEIPEELPIGGGKTYNVPMTISAFFYKIWAYEKKEDLRQVPQDDDSPRRNTIQFAPLLIGTKVDWFQVPERGPLPVDRASNTSFLYSILIFTLFVVLWIVFRFLRPRSREVHFELIPSNEIKVDESQVKVDPSEISIDPSQVKDESSKITIDDSMLAMPRMKKE